MRRYYRAKQWHTGAPGDKTSTPIDSPFDKPLFRPGWWVAFKDPQLCGDIGEMVGKVLYVVWEDGGTAYEVRHGYTRHIVAETNVVCRMSAVQ